MNSEPSATDAEYRYGAALAGQIELKWQQIWSDQGTFEVPNPVGSLANGTRLDPARKFYAIDMFPYPSGAGLHVGHGSAYRVRPLRPLPAHERHLVLHPIGSTPSASRPSSTRSRPGIHGGDHRAEHRQHAPAAPRLGLAHDPRSAVSTADPAARWTQWIFLQIFNSWYDPDAGRARHSDIVSELSRAPAGRFGGEPGRPPLGQPDDLTRRRVIDSFRLAYQAFAPVNWCPGLGTVLANEEVTADGRSQLGNYPVYRGRMNQWMLRITAFADRLSPIWTGSTGPTRSR